VFPAAVALVIQYRATASAPGSGAFGHRMQALQQVAVVAGHQKGLVHKRSRGDVVSKA
jgi:hypothetical protein